MKTTLLLLFINISFVIFAQKQEKYFQQKVDYKINVTLNDQKHTLSAFEEIKYTNNSPDTLKYIYFHLWPNAYKNNKTAFARQKLESMNTHFYFAKPEERGYIDSLNFKSGKQTLKWKYDDKNIDIAIVYLNEPLAPGKTIKISTPFFVKIPKTFSRMGHNGQVYQITQWYPKPAVYDRYGWHAFPYYDIGEFYSEYGNFDVSITLPENYIVAATGNLQTPSEQKFLDSLVEYSKKNASNIFIEKESSNKFKTIRYTEDNIHDFAWFANKNFLVSKSSVTLPHSFKKVTTWAFYTPKHQRNWAKATSYINDAIRYYSLWNGDYPYKNCTAVCGNLEAGGGMEYPTITIIAPSGGGYMLDEVITHEVGHNWFYGVLGFNERRYPWMDEGINSFNEIRYMETKYPNLTLSEGFIGANLNIFGLNQPYPSQQYFTYAFVADRNTDQACNLSSNNYSDLNYGAIVYAKTAQSFKFLYNYLGKDTFDLAMQTFYKKWQFKHPYPEDIQTVFQQITNKDLDWFFNDILGTKKKYDYKIKSVRKHKKDKTVSFKIKNNSNITAPVLFTVQQKDTLLKYKMFFTEKSKKITLPDSGISKIILNPNFTTTDINQNNNNAKIKSLFKTLNPLQINFLGGFDQPDKAEIYWFPVMGWNNYNKFMTGIMLYDNPFFIRKWEYFAMPIYAWGNSRFAGYGSLAYNWFFDSGIINTINFKASAKQFSLLEDKDFQVYRFGINTLFQKKNCRKNVRHTLNADFTYASNSYYLIYGESSAWSSMEEFININWSYENNRLFNPFSLSLTSTNHKDFSEIELEANYKITYRHPSSGLDIRAYFGGFLYNNSNLPMYNISVSGNDGFSDYQYDNIFLGRSELYGNHDFLSQQFSEAGGNLTIFTPYSTNKWLTALNLKTSLANIMVPIKLYFNIVNYNYESVTIENGSKSTSILNKTLWDTGLEINLFNNIVSFYFPITYSNDAKEVNQLFVDNFAERIRFVLRLNKLNLFKTVKEKETM